MEKMASGESIDVIPSFQLQSVSFPESVCRRGKEKNPNPNPTIYIQTLTRGSESESEQQQQQQNCDQHEQNEDDTVRTETSREEPQNERKEEMLKEKRRKWRLRNRSKWKRMVRRVSLVDTGLALFQVLYAQFRLLRPDHPMGRDVFGQFMDQSFIFPVILFLLIAFQGVLAIRLYGATFLIEQVWALTDSDNANANANDIENVNIKENDSEQQKQRQRQNLQKAGENVENPPSEPVELDLTPSEQDLIVEACLKRCRWWFRGGIFFLILSFLDTFVIIFLLTFDAYKRLTTIFLLTTINLSQIIIRIGSLCLVTRFMNLIAISSYNSHLNLNLNPNSISISNGAPKTERHSLCNSI